MIREFLSAAGLSQAVRGFDADMVVMNPTFEREVVPGALGALLDSLVVSYAFRLDAFRLDAFHDGRTLFIIPNC